MFYSRTNAHRSAHAPRRGIAAAVCADRDDPRVDLRARTSPANIGDIHAVDAVEIAVADTGVGIEPDDLARIFDRFYRTRTALDLALKGTGLGLSIAKSMIEAQGGQISVSSLKGRGTTFTVTLPVAVLCDQSQGELV